MSPLSKVLHPFFFSDDPYKVELLLFSIMFINIFMRLSSKKLVSTNTYRYLVAMLFNQPNCQIISAHLNQPYFTSGQYIGSFIPGCKHYKLRLVPNVCSKLNRVSLSQESSNIDYYSFIDSG